MYKKKTNNEQFFFLTNKFNLKIKPIIIAHRGESLDAPENTLAAINLAWQRNADAVEIDVHLTKNDQIVVIHDYNTARTGNQNKEIKTSTLDELKSINVGNTEYPGEKIPILNEVFATVPSDKKLIIEIKTGDEIIPRLIKEVNNAKLKKDQIEFIGFDFRTMVKIKNALPQQKVLWLPELRYFWLNKIFPYYIKKVILKTIENNLDGLDLQTSGMLNKELISEIKSANLLVYIWTEDDPEKARDYFEMGVDGITTNRAGWLKGRLI